MVYHLYLANLASQMQKTQKHLHPMLFDIKGNMYEDIRQTILKQTSFFINKSISKVKELAIDDIIICGSTARYLYNQNSDIDVKVIIKNPYPKLLQDSAKAINELLSLIATTYQGTKIQLSINKIPLDIKIAADFDSFLGYFSVLHNKWMVKPDPHLIMDVSIDEMIQVYFEKLALINRFMSELPLEDGTYSVESLSKISEFYSQINRTRTELKDYLPYKMLCKSGKMQEFGVEIVNHHIDSLSLE